jgi:gluconolactonase
MAWEFEPVAGSYKGSIDGLAWDGQAFLFSVPVENAIYRYDPRGGAVTLFRAYTSRTRGIALDADGNLYGCQAGSRRVARFNTDGSTSPMEYHLDGHFLNYPDDLAVDGQGRVWFSDPYSRTPSRGPQLQGPLDHASVLRLERRADRTWTIRRMTFDTRWPRGVLVSRDQRTLYVAESDNSRPEGARELRAYPILENDTLGPYAVMHTFGGDHRGPHRGIDGLCFDAEGNIVACAGSAQSGPGPAVYVFSPTGRVLETHLVPEDRPRNCAFGDADLGTLFVSSAGGHLYRVRNSGRRG